MRAIEDTGRRLIPNSMRDDGTRWVLDLGAYEAAPHPRLRMLIFCVRFHERLAGDVDAPEHADLHWRLAGRHCHGNGCRQGGQPYCRGMPLLSYRRHSFPPAVFQHAIWLYQRRTVSWEISSPRSANRSSTSR
jgi:hypothetical protein